MNKNKEAEKQMSYEYKEIQKKKCSQMTTNTKVLVKTQGIYLWKATTFLCSNNQLFSCGQHFYPRLS